MIDFLAGILVPLVKAFFVPLDLALSWLTLFGSLGALIVIGAMTGFAVNLFQKYCSNQKLLGHRREDLKTLKSLLRGAKENKDEGKASRLLELTSLISSRYALESLKPALYSVPPLCILAMWVGARLSYEPLRPDDAVEVIATFEDGANGFAYIVPNENLVPVGPAIAPIAIRKATPVATVEPETPPPSSAAEFTAADTSAPRNNANTQMKVASKPPETAAVEMSTSPQAHWNIRAEKEGAYQLQIRHGEDRYSVVLPIYSKGGFPPEQATHFRTESPSRDRLLSVELKLHESVPAAWWNVRMQSMGVYFIVALAFGLALRRVMGIQ